MIPSFTSYGLLPPGIHDCSLDDAYHYFCTNDHRKHIWSGLIKFIKLLKFYGLCQGDVILDGSFVTDKTIPNDIEFVLDAAQCDIQYQISCCMFFNLYHNTVHQELKVDAYPNIAGGNNFCSFFQYIGEKTAQIKGLNPKEQKGVLRIQSWANV